MRMRSLLVCDFSEARTTYKRSLVASTSLPLFPALPPLYFSPGEADQFLLSCDQCWEGWRLRLQCPSPKAHPLKGRATEGGASPPFTFANLLRLSPAAIHPWVVSLAWSWNLNLTPRSTPASIKTSYFLDFVNSRLDSSLLQQVCG